MTASRSALLLALLLTVVGWWVFWYQCDDAYIAFRYVANRQQGFGYVWNPPPFRPVEGYTSFLWVLLLDGVWTVTGLLPDRVATWLDLACALGQVVVTWDLACRLPLGPLHEAHRDRIVAFVLLGTVTNTTFLAWTSSGLETALFVLLLLAWFREAAVGRRDAGWTARLVTLATLSALTRPDGLLFLLATPFIVASVRLRTDVRWADALGFAPAALVGAHLLWRKATYGFWVPNTYVAKHVEPWPEAGLRYLGLFGLEFGFWLWIPVALVALWRARSQRGDLAAGLLHPGTIAASAFVAHAGYYVLRVGGDHFEYRIFAQLVPLLFLALPWMLARAGVGLRASMLVAGFALVNSWWIPWLDWAQMRGVDDKDAIPKLRMPVAPLVPEPLATYARWGDNLERWLVYHTIRISHQSHRMFVVQHARNFPDRDASLTLAGPAQWDGVGNAATEYPVISLGSVGIAGWSMPYVAILDWMGLNDLVVARNPIPSDWPRFMAHDRRAPAGYTECFRPNVPKGPGRFEVRPRTPPLTADEIRACEATWWERAEAGTLPGHPGRP